MSLSQSTKYNLILKDVFVFFLLCCLIYFLIHQIEAAEQP